jgi:hypothetical protein
MQIPNVFTDSIPAAVSPRRGRRARALALGGLIAAAGTLAVAAVAPALASATPTVTAHAKILPIPGFPHTGNILGAGADLETTFEIAGSEYSNGPPPLTQVKVYFPKGTKIHTAGFTTCPSETVKSEPGQCPKKSKAGPAGYSEGFVTLEGQRVHETVTVEPFFASGGLNFFIEGDHPVKIEKLATASWVFASSGPVLTVEVPLIETVAEAPDASATKIVTKAGGAIKKGGKTIYYGTIPKKCPKGGFAAKAELSFLGVTSPVTAETTVPCPPKK